VRRVTLKLKTLTPRQWLAIVLTAVAAVAFAVALMTGLSRLLSTPTVDTATAAPATPVAPAVPAAPVPKIKVTLFFASEDGQHLVGSEHEVPLAEGVVAQARAIVEAQLAAQPRAPLAATIPAGVTLRGLFVSERQEAFVDLDSVIRSAHPGGTMQEIMTVYTVVHAVLANLPTLQEVQILIDGQEVDTRAGHVDLRRPLRKNESLVASSQ
jgi:hypothetical protein